MQKSGAKLRPVQFGGPATLLLHYSKPVYRNGDEWPPSRSFSRRGFDYRRGQTALMGPVTTKVCVLAILATASFLGLGRVRRGGKPDEQAHS